MYLHFKCYPLAQFPSLLETPSTIPHSPCFYGGDPPPSCPPTPASPPSIPLHRGIYWTFIYFPLFSLLLILYILSFLSYHYTPISMVRKTIYLTKSHTCQVTRCFHQLLVTCCCLLLSLHWLFVCLLTALPFDDAPGIWRACTLVWKWAPNSSNITFI